MDVRVDSSPATEIKVDALIGCVFKDGSIEDERLASVDQALDGALGEIISRKEFHGRRYETDSLLAMGKVAARRVMLVGGGKQQEYDLYYLRNIVAAAARAAHKKGARSLAFVMPTPDGANSREVAQAVTEGAMLGLVNPDIYKTNERDEDTTVEQIVIVGDGSKEMNEGARRGGIMAAAANFTRSLAEEPANIMTPARLAEEARKMVKQHKNLEITVLGRKEMEAKGMGSLLGVALGSHNEPQLIVINYNGGKKGDKRKIALVGKGITFDSGGTSIKPAQDMHYMKYDMCGAAAVIGAMQAIAEFGPAINVIGIGCAVENMPGGGAQRPGDVVRAMNGKTIEVLNTDAEGRLVLADGVAYAQEQGATHLLDICTLTGAAVISLGHAAAALLGQPQGWLDQVKQAAEESGERVWQLPLFSEYREQLKSNIADIANVGGRAAGTAVGAIFVKEFIEEGTEWAHLDIAAVAYTERDLPYLPHGSSGFGVRTMTNLVLDAASVGQK
jgi:leucyl aminopeptidase